MEIGLACPVCGQLNVLRAQGCARCGSPLAPPPVEATAPPAPASAWGGPAAPAPAAPTAPAAAPPPSAAEAPRFDPATGQPIHAAAAPGEGGEQKAARTMFFGALQQQDVVPRLVVIKGEGGDGVTFHLRGQQQSMGRGAVDIPFTDDVFLSPEHARLTVQAGRLFVQDVGSTNGIFLRIKRPMALDHGDLFLVGEQLLRLDSTPLPEYAPNANGTYFFGSPRPEATFRVVQVLAGGGDGAIRCAAGRSLSIGRDGNTFDFPEDRFISGHHAQLDVSGDTGQVLLTDTGSRNGTFIRLKGAQELVHGDYMFVGQQLFRVEIA
jgi:pSer/pThr/pTyr-binding forkhead associated (FHA) protein